MRVFWKGEDLGEFRGETMDVQEMRWVKQQAPEYRNPMNLLRAAGAIAVPVLDEHGKPALDADGDPKLEASPDWDPDALTIFIALLMRRQGRSAFPEDISGTLADLRVEADPSEQAAAKAEADAEPGKAPEPPQE